MITFIKASTKKAFEAELEKGNIQEDKIAFILDTKEIWALGLYFRDESGGVSELLLQSALREYFSNIYTKEEADARFLTEHQSIIGFATKEFVSLKISEVVGGAPETLDTLKEIADALADNATMTNVSEAIKVKANKDDVYTKQEASELFLTKGNYLTLHQSLENLATKEEVTTLKSYAENNRTLIDSNASSIDTINKLIVNIANKEELDALKSRVATNEQSISNNVSEISNIKELILTLQEYVDNELLSVYSKADSDDLFATYNWVNQLNFLKSHLNISNLATKDELASVKGVVEDNSLAITILNGGATVENSVSHKIAETTYTKQEADDRFLTLHLDISYKANTADVNSLADRVTNNESDISNLKGDSKTNGSVAKALSDAKNYTDSQVLSAVNEIKNIGYITLHLDISSKADLSALDAEILRALAAEETKLDKITDLNTIRTGAAAGATAYQKPADGIPSNDLAQAVLNLLTKASTALLSQDLNELKQKVAALESLVSDDNPTTAIDKFNEIVDFLNNIENSTTLAGIIEGIYASISEKYFKPSAGIPSSDLTAAVQTNLNKAASAYQKPTTGIPVSDLSSTILDTLVKASTALQEHQDISGKADKTKTVSEITYSNKKLVKTINGVVTDVVSASTIVTDGGGIKDVSDKANKSDVYTKAEADAKFLTEHLSLADYVKTDVLNTYIEEYCSYGVEFDVSISSPDCVRIGNSSLHRTLPIQSKMKGCLLDDSGKVVEYLNPNSWLDAVRDGSKGLVMVEIPAHYRKFVTDGNKRRVCLSELPLPGYHKVPKYYISAYEASLNRTNQKLSSVVNSAVEYRGGNNTSGWDAEDRTLLGRPATNISRTNFRAYARNRGSINWNCMVYDIQIVLYWLFVVEYATLNSLKAYTAELDVNGYHLGGLGDGVVNLNSGLWSTWNNYNPFVPCGYTDSLGNNTGVIDFELPAGYGASLITHVNRYRGIENPFGHIWQWTDGINVRIHPDSDETPISEVFVCSNPAHFTDSSYNNYSYVGNEARINGWVKNIIFGDRGDIMPTTMGGSSNAFFSDHHYTNIPTDSVVLRGVLFGGAANLGSNSGLACSGSSYAPSAAYADIGSRLCYIP